MVEAPQMHRFKTYFEGRQILELTTSYLDITASRSETTEQNMWSWWRG